MARLKVGKIPGGRTKKTFPVHWDPDTQKVYIEKRGFFGSTMIDTKMTTSSVRMAFIAAEAYLFDK